MKYLQLITLSFLVFACNMAPKVDYILFSGKIENPNGKNVTISRAGFEQNIPLDDQGAWSDTLRLEAGYYRFDDENESSEIYLAPGYDLSLTLNTEEFDESIKYEGAGAEINNYLASKYMLMEQNQNLEEFAKLDETGAQAHLDGLQNQLTDNLKSQKDFSEEFVSMEKRNIQYSVEGLKSYYGYYHGKEEEGYEPSKEFKSSWEAIDYDREDDFQNLNSYKSMINNYHGYKMEKLGEGIAPRIAYIEAIKNPKVQSSLVRSLNYQISPGGEDNDIIVEAINKYSDSDRLKTQTKEKAEAMAKLVPGNPSPVFAYSDVNGNEVTMESFKGKFVYVDVWATWCGPCIREIPHLKALEEEYRDNNIVFVGVSIDVMDNKQKWLDFVADRELVGIQVMSDNDWSSAWVKEYAVYSIPRFLLIDPKGNIVDAMAPRPSERDALDKLFANYNI
jgi:thiol-disulfide isomerase/thioredoxin